MLLMDTPNLLTWGFRIYFYCLLLLSFNIPSLFGIIISVAGFLIMEYFCEDLAKDYQ